MILSFNANDDANTQDIEEKVSIEIDTPKTIFVHSIFHYKEREREVCGMCRVRPLAKIPLCLANTDSEVVVVVVAAAAARPTGDAVDNVMVVAASAVMLIRPFIVKFTRNFHCCYGRRRPRRYC